MVPPGGFSRGGQFERERVVPPLSRLLCLLSCRSKKVRPCWQALAESQLDNRLKSCNRVTITTSKCHPQSKPPAYPPLAPSVTPPACQLPPGGSYGLLPFHIGLCFWKVPAVNPSVKNQRFLPAPFGKGAFGFSLLAPISSRCRSTSRQFTPHTTPPKCKDTPDMHKAYRGFCIVYFRKQRSDLTSTLKFYV